MSRFALILPAAGRSVRLGDSRGRKQYLQLHGQAVWLWAIEPFRRRDDVVQIIVVVPPDDLDWFTMVYRAELMPGRQPASTEGAPARTPIKVAAGGQERADSVANALWQLSDDIDYVAVHDAARPLVTSELIDAVFAAAREHDAAIPALPISGTVKRVRENRILETVPRDGLWIAQTPQVFRRDLLTAAYQQRGNETFTDEAQMVESLGETVHIVEGDSTNLKITTPSDLVLAERLLSLNGYGQPNKSSSG